MTTDEKSVREQFNQQQQLELQARQKEIRDREEAALMKALNTRAQIEPEDSASQGGWGDVGNFFRMIGAWIVGMFQGDLTEFYTISETYFPDRPVNDAEETERDSRRTPEERERRQGMTQAAKELREAGKNPESPLRSMTSAQLLEYFATTITPLKPLPRYADKLGFNKFIETIFGWEGNGNILNEPTGGKSKFGFYSSAHPDMDVTKLDFYKARELAKTERWDPIQWSIVGGEGKASAAVKLIALDTAMQYIPGTRDAKTGAYPLKTANGLLEYAFKQSGGDIQKMPEIMLKKREEFYRERAATHEPSKKYLTGWLNRLDNIRGEINRYDMIIPTDKLIAMPPVDLKKYGPGSAFGTRTDPFDSHKNEAHRGSDYSVPANTPLAATQDCAVVFTRTTAQSGGYGNLIGLKLGDHVYAIRAHLKHFNGVEPGQTLREGQIYGYSGSTGHSTGPHLHSELWIERGGKFYVVDERKAFGKNLQDPHVQDELIADSKKSLGERNSQATMSAAIPKEFLDNIVAVTGQPPGAAPATGGTAGLTLAQNIFRK